MKVTALAVVLVVAAVAAPGAAHADSDVEMWSELGLTHKLNKKWRLTLDQGLRFDDSVSRFNQSLTELGVNVRAARWLRLAAAYRFTYRQTNAGNLKVRHRFHADARARVRRGKLRADYRLRLQQQIRDFDGGDGTRFALRNRAKVSWKLNRTWRPYVAAELFHAEDDMAEFGYAKTRLTVGSSYALKTGGLDMYYRLEVPSAASDLTVHIVGLGYGFDL